MSNVFCAPRVLTSVVAVEQSVTAPTWSPVDGTGLPTTVSAHGTAVPVAARLRAVVLADVAVDAVECDVPVMADLLAGDDLQLKNDTQGSTPRGAPV